MLLSLLLISTSILSGAESRTVGLLLNDERAFEGYTLFAPTNFNVTYLVDNEGRLVHSWSSDLRLGSMAVYLRENGHLLRTCAARPAGRRFNAGGALARVQEYAWDGTLVWDFEYSNESHALHHDIEPLPNGNVLMIAWELKTAAEALSRGRDPDLLKDGELWPDHILEVRPTGPTSGEIVWEWHAWDHLVQDLDPAKPAYGDVAEHPELLDVNFEARRDRNRGIADWNHINSIDYNAALDQILLSVRGNSEILVIDHSTTTEEAAGSHGGRSGKGGDILYRWGNPASYRAGTAADRQLYGQHDAQWIEAGRAGEGGILIFNNGQARPEGSYSSVDVFDPPVSIEAGYPRTPGSPYGPAEAAWTYTAPRPTSFFSSAMSGAQRLPNGNTLVCDTARGRLFEVTLAGELVWEYINPVTRLGPLLQGAQPSGNQVFKVRRYAPGFAGFRGRTLAAGMPVELYPSSIFLRGDCNGDGSASGVDDAITMLLINFLGNETAPCRAACDVNGDGEIRGVQDALDLLTHNFIGGVVIPPPHPDCGPASLATDLSSLGCETPLDGCP